MKAALKFWLILILGIGLAACNGTQKESKQEVIQAQMANSPIKIKRYASVIKVKPEMLKQYKQLHANPWKAISEQITKSNIRNYSIYLKDDLLFGYFEYVGDDFESDMAEMAKDSITKEWWKLTDPCQIPLETRAEGEWWASMEEIFHQD
jgi:L-rhamnose mutarotase